MGLLVVMVASQVGRCDVKRYGGVAARANERQPGEGGEGEDRRDDSGVAPLKVREGTLVEPTREREKRGFLRGGGRRARDRLT